MGPARIRIFDTTLRDGEQSPGCSMHLEEKLRMALQLEKLGVDVLEAGFPVASEGDFEAVRAIARALQHPIVAGLCRALPADIDRAWEALKEAAHPRIHTFLATSDIHLEHKLRISREEALAMAVAGVRHARARFTDVEFSAEDATRTDPDYLCQVIGAVIEAGATTVNIPDTVGYTTPSEYFQLIRALMERVPNIDRAVVSVHCHNDLGLAVANSLAAIEAGARQVECTVNGIGERAGNAALEEVVMALRVRQDRLPYVSGIRTEEIAKSSQLLSNITGVHPQPNKAIVGKNAFAHESGIHQHGVLRNRSTYEIMTPESVGVKVQHIVLGKHSGRAALAQRYQELGYELAKPELEKAYKLFTKLCDVKKEVFEEDLVAILRDGLSDIPETWKLRLAQVTAGTQGYSHALVQLRNGDQEPSGTGHGDGPVAALVDAIAGLTSIRGEVLDFQVRAVSEGSDAVGEVFMKVEAEGSLLTGKAASTDIIEGAARAYLNAVNKALHARQLKASRQAVTA
ncbi:MAG TPA: 2-isopropylmalate synthase [Holophagaceae bacterium]|nr:2-isopropylmalate synthase [Holophagaceae bacterium]